MKANGGIIPGDIVNITKGDNDDGVISSILPRSSELIRPRTANVEQMIIILSSVPAPDLLLIDKLIISCIQQNIMPVICINKTDILREDFIQKILKSYKNVCKIIAVSAETGNNMKDLEDVIKNRFSVFAGQSAVGKSSVINRLFPNLKLETGELSKKTERGKHTTRHTEIFVNYELNAVIADTPGFSAMTNEQLSHYDLNNYYNDFNEFSDNCSFNNCLHIFEPDCAVKEALGEGNICLGRYERYLKIFDELKNKKAY